MIDPGRCEPGTRGLMANNLCTAIRATQGKGVMPDGTSRFTLNKNPIQHYMGCSTFANFIVLPEIAVAKVREDAPFNKICYIGCGVTTGNSSLAASGRARPSAARGGAATCRRSSTGTWTARSTSTT
jgi:Zn-dependent alcohol dehydrogenase